MSEERFSFEKIAREEFMFAKSMYFAPVVALLTGLTAKWAEVRKDAERVTPD